VPVRTWVDFTTEIPFKIHIVTYQTSIDTLTLE